MNYKRITLLLFTLGIALMLTLTAGAQNLLKENKYYEEAQELKRQAEQAMENGEYDRATELSEEAQELMQQAESYAERMVRIYKARGWKNRAEDYMQWAEGIAAEDRYPEKWKNASDAFGEAERLFEDEKWEESISSSRKTISIIEEMEARTASKPRYYVVREWAKTGDCFWNIAGYDFVYDDPWQWRKLYEANKNKLPEPDNPDLINPGTKLRIPSISNEPRRGTWQP